MIRRALVLLFVLPLACNRVQPEQRAPTASATVATPVSHNERDLDDDNLLNIAWGASVVSRTGELNLENSAVHAIDGMPHTRWISPPGGASGTFVFSLAAPSRIERLGVTTVGPPEQVPAKVRFESSQDGRSWREIHVLALQPSRTPQIVDVTPFDARYLRVSTIEPSDYYAHIRSIHAIGRELAPPHPIDLTGCWTINGAPATIEQRGTRITGAITRGNRMVIDGGSDGRVAQLMWREGPMWGYGAITLSADGAHLSGLRFHEEIAGSNVGEAFFGERCTGASLAGSPPPDAPSQIFQRVGRLSLFGLVFDEHDQLVEQPSGPELDAAVALIRSLPPSQRLRIAAHELRVSAPADVLRQRTLIRARAVRDALQKRGIDASRLEIAGSGSDANGVEITYAIQRLLASRVDLERVR